MRARSGFWLVPVLAFGLLPVVARAAEGTAKDQGWCDEGGSRNDMERHCEVREISLPAAPRIEVDAAPNGGIRVEGWDQEQVRILAKVVASARTEADARQLASQVRIETSGTIRAEGPATRDDEGWWVSYRLQVPRHTALGLSSQNGGIRIRDVQGRIEFRTQNGGVHLEEVGGDVSGRTTNGGVNVSLAGTAWEGEGLDVETTNGGVRLEVPRDYNAHVETGTVNGRLRVDFPVTVQGRLNGRHVAFDVGKGGRTVRAVTTNGGVVIRQR